MDPDKPCTKYDIEAGIVAFQTMNLGLNDIEITGKCDSKTVEVMGWQRCGCTDTGKDRDKKMMPQNFIGPQEYRLGNTKWRKKELTWSVLKYPANPVTTSRISPSQVDDAMKRALDIWAKETTLTFRELKNNPNADITIKFETGRHTTSPPYYDFDGPGNVLAHAFFPESGVVHFDDDENYILNSNAGTELYIVAAHEFGHTLGISHSNINSALMAPYYRYSSTLRLDPDDIGAVQALYGKSDKNNPTTPKPTTLKPTTRMTNQPTTRRPSPAPEYCNIKIKASFEKDGKTYLFAREKAGVRKTKTYVYQFSSTQDGLKFESRKPIEEVFTKVGSTRYPRAYPYRVDAAAYIPDRKYIFLFSGTRAYRYSTSGQTEGPFNLDRSDGFPKWMDVSEFPERPRAAVAMPYSRYNAYYMLIFGTTMVWDWNFFSQRVGAWAYPIDVFGRNMPQRVDGAHLQKDKSNVIFFKNDAFYNFDLRYRRVLESTAKDVKKDFFGGSCA